MTALTNNRYTKHRDGLVTAHPVAVGANIFKGSIICANQYGYAVPGADEEGYVVIGVALEGADNSQGADGHISVRVQTLGVFSFGTSSVVPQAHLGAFLCVVDDQTLAVEGQTKCCVVAGRLEALDGPGYAWLRPQLGSRMVG